MTGTGVRLAVRGVIVHDGRLLLVNAWPGRTHLWCAPGGGVEPHQSLPDTLIREIWEETGLAVQVDAPCLVNEFHDPEGSFHQVDIYFRCTLLAPPDLRPWTDPEGVVTHRRWVDREEMAGCRSSPTASPRSRGPQGLRRSTIRWSRSCADRTGRNWAERQATQVRVLQRARLPRTQKTAV